MAQAHELMRADFIVADVSDTVGMLIGKMERAKQDIAVVFDGKTYRGMAAKKWLLSSRIDPQKMKLNNLITHRSKSKTPFFVPKLSPDTELKEIARLLATADVHALPVIETEKKKEAVVGIVHSIDVANELKQEYSKVKATELASMKLITINQDEELGKAMNLMSKQGIGRVVVVDDAEKLVGVISLSDILNDVTSLPRANVHISKAGSHQQGKRSGFGTSEKTDTLKLPVHNAITHVPNCCTTAPDVSVSAAIDAMVDANVTSVVLVKKDVPVGILTVKDILDDYAK